MRGTVAKRLRKEARKISEPTKYKTKWFAKKTGKTDDKGKAVVDYRGTITCTGYRRAYQDLKKAYK
jgi:hypothetical protein